MFPLIKLIPIEMKIFFLANENIYFKEEIKELKLKHKNLDSKLKNLEKQNKTEVLEFKNELDEITKNIMKKLKIICMILKV